MVIISCRIRWAGHVAVIMRCHMYEKCESEIQKEENLGDAGIA
jgi:hypothetical protein